MLESDENMTNDQPGAEPFNPTEAIRHQQIQIGQLQDMVQQMLVSQVRHDPRAQPHDRPILKKEHIELIPVFSGSPQTLHEFLDVTQKLTDRFYNNNDPDDFQNYMIISAIKSKIHPPASEQVFSSSVTTYNEIREALLNAYSDRRDDMTLVIELVGLRQTDGETPFKFHDRVQKALNLIIAYMQNHNTANSEILIRNYKRLALRCFLLQLKEPLGSILRTRQPPDLGTALSWLTNDYQTLANNVRGKSPQNSNSRSSQVSNPHNFAPKQQNYQNYRANFQNKPPIQPPPNPNPNQPKPQGFKPNQPGRPPFQNPKTNYQNPNTPKPQGSFRTNNQPPPRPASTQVVPMSWRTTNPNFNNIEEDPEPSQNLETEEYPDTEETPYEYEYQETNSEETPFLEEVSLQPPPHTN